MQDMTVYCKNAKYYNMKKLKYANGEVQYKIYKAAIHIGKKKRAKKENEELENKPVDTERSLQNSLRRTLNEIYNISRSNIWDYFITFTFDPQKVDSFDYKAVTNKLSKWLNNCRRSCGNEFKYIVVPELHKSGRYHFHGLLSCCDGLGLIDSSHKTKNGQTIYNIGKYKLGFTTATKVDNTSAVAKYITKYTTKELITSTPNSKRYWVSKNCKRAEEEIYLLKGIEKEILVDELEESITSYKDVKCYTYVEQRIRYLEIKEVV